MKSEKNDKYHIPTFLLLIGLIAFIVSDHPNWGIPIAVFFTIFSFISFIIVGKKRTSKKKTDSTE